MTRLHAFAPILLLALATAATATRASEPAEAPRAAHFLLLGSYHMDNPGRDVHNTRADDVLAPQRQRQIAEVAQLVGRYRPTRIFVEAPPSSQQDLDRDFDASCNGDRPLDRDETEQLGFRIACAQGLPGVVAVDWNDLGPIRDEASINYLEAVERHGQQALYAAHKRIGKALNDQDQATLDDGSVRDMLLRLNSPGWRQANARAYYRIGQLGTADDAIGANWVTLWFGRNLRIFNAIAGATRPGDRVLVVYGAGHGNHLRQLAEDSGLYRVEDTASWLQEQAAPAAAGTP